MPITTWLPGQNEALSAILSGQDVIQNWPSRAGKSLPWMTAARHGEGLTLSLTTTTAAAMAQVQWYNARAPGKAMYWLDLEEDQEEPVYPRLFPGRHHAESAIRGPGPPSIDILVSTYSQVDGELLLYLEDTYELGHFARIVFDHPQLALSAASVFRFDAHCAIQRLARNHFDIPQVATMSTSEALVPQVATLLEMDEPFLSSRPLVRRVSIEMMDKRTPVADAPFSLAHHLHYRFSGRSGLIFTRTRGEAQKMQEELEQVGESSVSYHSFMSLEDKDEALNRWKAGEVNILCAPHESMAFGLIKENVSFVCHLSIPKSLQTFYNCIGRLSDGGVAITLFNATDYHKHDANITENDYPPERQLTQPQIDQARQEALKVRRFGETSSCLWTKLLRGLWGPEISISTRQCHRTAPCDNCRSAAISHPDLFEWD